MPFSDDEGNIIGLVGIGRDITKLKETEDKLIEQSQNLKANNIILKEHQEEIRLQSEELAAKITLLKAKEIYSEQ